ncbi:MAG: hypothetical protein L0206_18020 [Actinobacteria bacterium]|nr:hypothetical protein [Actinomycetota bacterium]
MSPRPRSSSAEREGGVELEVEVSMTDAEGGAVAEMIAHWSVRKRG